MSHTPGPWKLVVARFPLVSPSGDRVRMYVVATNHPNGKWESIYCEDEQDARLIAAAPEMLEALEETYSLYGMTDDELRTNWGRVFDCVRTAIRKAKGER